MPPRWPAKLTAGAMPAPLKKEFAGSLFASIPGDNAAWILLGLIEATIVVLLAVSLIRGEFLATHRKPFLLTGLSVGLFATGLMGFTNDMVGSTAGAVELFTYFGLIAIVMMLVRQLAPYRSMGWLSGDDSPAESGAGH
jgi:Na+-transporting NADH:ubiquinone oxidoreductase subunit NqrB